jgi:hypothetical protein
MDADAPEVWQTVSARRGERPQGALYIDLLFELAGLQTAGLASYPPLSDGLHSLLQSVDHCYFDALKRNCLK